MADPIGFGNQSAWAGSICLSRKRHAKRFLGSWMGASHVIADIAIRSATRKYALDHDRASRTPYAYKTTRCLIFVKPGQCWRIIKGMSMPARDVTLSPLSLWPASEIR
jgi:hypothetical protein